MSHTLTYGHAIREALVEEMRRDPTVILYGEDVAVYGGIFRVLAGLSEDTLLHRRTSVT